MAENQINFAVDGQELAQADVNTILGPLGLMDDRVFAEFLRMPPFDGTNVYKSIFPLGGQAVEGSLGGTAVNNAAVQSSGTANGSIVVSTFRCVIGSRTALGTSVLANYRDIRTGLFVGPTFSYLLANNSSGFPRYDLVYATLTVDTATGSQTRRIKNPTTGVVTSGPETTFLANPVTVAVVTGTGAATPLIPALPADVGGAYNVALAAVLVPNGFTSGTQVVQQGIRDLVGDKNLTNGNGQTMIGMSPTAGVLTGPVMASGNNDRAGTYASNFPWGTTPATSRSPVFLPPSMIGGVSCIACVDDTNASPSHANGSIVDDTIDWRRRIFKIVAQATGNQPGAITYKWSMDPTLGAAPNSGAPYLYGNGASGAGSLAQVVTQMGNSMSVDGFLASGGSSIYNSFTANYAAMAAASSIGLYVTAADGVLRWFVGATHSGLKWTFWIEATQPFPNY